MCWHYDLVADSFTIPHIVTGYIGNTLVSRTIDTVRYASPGVSAFSELSSVEVSEGITSLEAAFTYCDQLTDVELPSSLKTMVGAFNACTALSTLTIPDSVTEIGDSCFNECSNLVSVSWPVSLEKIGDDAFRRCSSFSSVELPEGCREIGYRAFISCSCLTNLSLGRCERIGESAFQSCVALETLTIPDSMTNIANSAFAGCSGLVCIEFPSTLKSIGTTAFEGCSSLCSIRIPDGVETIGINAFKNCESVSDLFIPTSVSDAGYSFVGVNPYELTEGTLWASVGLANVTNFTLLPGAATFSGLRYQTQDAKNIQRIELPDTVTTLWKSAFSYYTNLTELVLPLTIQSVGDMAFCCCNKLSEFPLLNASVTNWGNSVYWGCSGVEKLVVPGSMKSIPDSMFRECTGLKELVIEEGVETVAGTAFMGDADLELITLGSTVTNLLFASYSGPDASKVKVATFYQLHPPKYVVKAFLQNFNGAVYYPSAFASEWAAVLNDAGIVNHQAMNAGSTVHSVVAGAKCSVDVGLKGQGYSTKTLPKGLSYSDKTGLVTGTCKTATDDDGVTVTFTKKGAEDVVMIFAVRAETTPTVDCECLAEGSFVVGVTGGALGDRALPSIPLLFEAESGVKSVTAKNLPTGMKLVQDKTTKVWSITGVSTKAATYETSITLTTTAGNKVTEKFTVAVAALPSGATGTFNGFVFVDATSSSRQEAESPSSERRGEDAASTGTMLNCGTLQVTVSDVGKIAAKVVAAAGTYSFSASGWDSVNEGVYSVKMETKKGDVLTLACDANAAWNAKQVTGTFTAAAVGGATALPVEAQKNAFGKQWFFKAAGDEANGWVLLFAENAKSAALIVTLNADGKTTVAGTLNGTPVVSGTKTTTPTYKVSSSGYADVSGIGSGAIFADFAPVITVNKVKKVLSLRINLWFDRQNEHDEVGSAQLVE